MVNKTFSFEGIVGNQVGTGASDPSDTPFNAIGVAAGSFTYSSEQAAFGTRSGKLQAASGGDAVVRWDLASHTTGAARIYLYFDTLPASDHTFLRVSPASGGTTQVVAKTTGSIFVYGQSTGSSAYQAPTNTIPVKQWICVDVYYEVGTTGKLKLGVYNLDGTVRHTSGNITADTGTAPVTALRIGKYGGTNSTLMYMDSPLHSDTATDLLGPLSTPPTIVVAKPVRNVIDLRNSTAGAGTLSFPAPTAVSNPDNMAVTSIVPGVWAVEDTKSSTWKFSVVQTNNLSAEQDVAITIPPTGTIYVPKIPSGANPGTGWQ